MNPRSQGEQVQELASTSRARIGRIVYLFLGLGFVGLAAVGVVLPILPTTPFLLVASACFIRSSPRLNRWLLRSRWFGPLLRDWHRHRGVRPHVKVVAVLVMVAVVTASILWSERSVLFLAVLVVLALIGLGVVLALPVVREGVKESRQG